MQLARLIEPRENRSFGQKLRQIFRAVQIERRLSKQEILERYLTLAPYGGNLEGVRAASLAYFGKEPKRLTVSEAALLVALPQLPERRARPQPGRCASRPRPRACPHGDIRPARRDGGRTRRARRGRRLPPRPAGARRPCRRRRACAAALRIQPPAHDQQERAGKPRSRRARRGAKARPARIGRDGHGRRDDRRNPRPRSAPPTISTPAAPAGST